MKTITLILASIMLCIMQATAQGTFVSNDSGQVPKFTCSNTEAEIAALNGIQKLTIGTDDYYIGTRQVSSNNQNPIIAKFNSSGTQVWCREDYETTGADGRGIGFFWTGTDLYVVCSTDGTQGNSSQDFRRFTGSGWLRTHTDGSTGANGSAKSAVIFRINTSDGAGIDDSGTFLTARLTSGKMNTFRRVTDMFLNSDGDIVIKSETASHPRDIDKGRMAGSSSGTDDYTLVMNTSLSSAICAEAVGYTSETGSCNISLLPVELLGFFAEKQDQAIKLTWTTASEENNKGFEVLRSSTGKEWTPIGFIPGSATTLELQNYTFLDQVPLPGINYYRLKQLDFDGTFEYSNAISIIYESNVNKDELVVFPNPFTDALNYSVADMDQVLSVQLLDTYGRLAKVAKKIDGTLTLKDLNSGTYLLILKTRQKNLQQLVVKQ